MKIDTIHPKMATEGLRLTVVLSDFASRRLIWWAKTHDKTKSAYAAQIIEARVESDISTIEASINQCAQDRGISPDKLKEEWLLEDNYLELKREGE
ncbi:MAG: hypothetical protein WBG70_16870 [Spirulinaceae cyanobacterium]